jgi:hypothetical protein
VGDISLPIGSTPRFYSPQLRRSRSVYAEASAMTPPTRLAELSCLVFNDLSDMIYVTRRDGRLVHALWNCIASVGIESE